MTVSIYLASIADAISQISITGVTVKDKDQIVANWSSQPNVVYPIPDGWITNFSLEYDSVLQGTNAPMDISYTLNYRFLGEAVGDLGNFPKAYSNLVDKLVLILNAMIAVPGPYSGKVEMEVAGVSVGPRIDPAGNRYFGADIGLNIKEMHN